MRFTAGIEPAGSPLTMSRDLGHAERVGGRGADGRHVHLDDLPHAVLRRHVAARQHQGPDLLAAVVRTPEADERAVTEGEKDRVGGPHAEPPEAIAPHLGDPLPVLGAVEDAQRLAPAGAGGEVAADRVVQGRRDEIAEERFLRLRFHPLGAGHDGNAAQVVERLQLLRMESGLPELAPVEVALGLAPLA
jgi:hypothetical protein